MALSAHWEELDRLVLVAGHAVYTADDFRAPQDDASWFLQSFQKGEPPFYIEHAMCGVEIATAERRSLLVYSGGQTRREAGPRSEAQSYWLVARHFGWWNHPSVELRCTTEEFARDSFENLLFGISRFKECTNKYPRAIDVVSWAFKAKRFEKHRGDIGYPADRFTFIGVNNPVDLDGARLGEEKAIEAFDKDPFGTREDTDKDITKTLGWKRRARNPFQRVHPYRTSCPRIKAILEHQSSQGDLNFNWDPLLRDDADGECGND